jgi:hypothetical protein
MAKKKISGRPHEERKAKELIDKIAKKRAAKRPKRISAKLRLGS